MTRWVQFSAILPLLAAVVLLATVGATMVRRPGTTCRGGRSWTDWLPWRWFFPRLCGYDLAGLPIADGKVRCPECGLVQTPVSRGRSRLLPRMVASSVLVVLAAACWKASWIRYGRWAPYTPTWVLAELDYLPMPGRVESEMLERVEQGRIGPWQRARVANVAIHHLGSDHRNRNARWACDVLWRMGREAVPKLEAALDDKEFQRRQYAAELLRSRANPNRWEVGPPEWYEPPERLIEVSVEAFRADRFERSNARSSFEFLLRYRDRVLPRLERALRSDDKQQAFLSAVMAGFLKADDLAPLAAPLLVEHLKHNNFEGDARTAAPALLSLGDAGRPYLLPAVNGDDMQARELAWAIIKTMDHQRLSDTEKEIIRTVTMRYSDLAAASNERDELWMYYDF